MGSSDLDGPEFGNEMPQHRVLITKSFHLGVYPVTQAEYERVMKTNPSEFKSGDKLPVEDVSWDEAMDFCRKLSDLSEEKASGRIYRLPTEAEWEYACRAGTTTRWYCGDDEDELGRVAWCDANSDDQTHPVGEKQPNAWGLYDMHGNVWEWCEDWYDKYSAEDMTDPKGPSEATHRVMRGGSWWNSARICGAASRFNYEPRCRYGDLGFRVAADLPGKKSQDNSARD
jgi:formylglycine-generating enzyme required for sulfatase activity